MAASFVHLQCHTEFSLLEGAIQTKALIKTVQEYDMPGVALTDNGCMYGAIDFYVRMKEEGLNPIMGVECFIVGNRLEKDRDFNRIILLAKSQLGYRNLIKLVSIGHLEGFYYRPRIDMECLREYHQDLVAIDPLSRGVVAEHIRANQLDTAKQKALEYQALFGDDFYLGLERIGSPLEDILNKTSVQIADDIGCGYVATNNVYYLAKEDAYLKGVLGCIQRGKRLEEDTRFNLQSKEMYFKSPDEMQELFEDLPKSIENTVLIAEKCKVEIDTDQVKLPHFECPDQLTDEQYLEKLVWEGMAIKYDEVTDEMKERVAFELKIINRMQYPRYFLIIFDFLDFCRESNIPFGPGRGSAAGSIVAYALNITNIDPIRYNLLFERFLNPERVSMPDVDLDFCIKRRGEVIDYIVQKYGDDKVSQIITFGTMAARGVVRDVGRVLGVPLDEVDYVAKLIPSAPGQYTSIPEALEEVPELVRAQKKSADIKHLLDVGSRLEGQTRHTSTHAAGVVISYDPLTDVVPLVKNDGQIVTQYPMNDLDKIGLLKMDILGLRNLTVMTDACALIKENTGELIDLEEIELDEPKTYELFCSGETIGVFQLESRGMRQLIKDLQPSVFEDIIALLALYRPGPLGSGMVSDFVSNKHGRTEVQYDMPELEPILKDTYGLIVYQEQVMQIASVVGGFSLGQADMLRRAMGKKKKDVMDKMKDDFLAGAEKKSFDVKTAQKIFELCYKFAEYGFNKSHSAAYAKISFQTAFLKANYPYEYMTSLLSSVYTFSDKVSLYIAECKSMGIEVLPPDVNQSKANFSIVMHNEKRAICYGLSAIKNVGEAAVESIVEAQKEGNFQSLSNFCQRVDLKQVNKRVVESLIKSGSMDDLGTRSYLLQIMDKIIEHAQIVEKERRNGQTCLFGGDSSKVFGVIEEDPFEEQYEGFSNIQKLAMEKELLGLYITGHPLDDYREMIDKFEYQIKHISSELDGQEVSLIGLIQNTRKTVTKTKKEMKIGSLEDLTGEMTIMMFQREGDDTLETLFLDDHIVKVTGRCRCRNDEVTMMVDQFELMSQVEHQKSVVIDLEDIIEPKLLENIRDYLSHNRGELPVYFQSGENVVLTHKRYWMRDDALCMTHLGQLVGQGRLWMTQ